MANVIGTANADLLIGTADADLLQGLGGNDELRGLEGNDALEGGDGQDFLNGGLGDDTLNGGNSDPLSADYAVYRFATGGIAVNLGAGTASGADGNDTLISIENVIGSAFNDTLLGFGGRNWFKGLGGDDVIDGFDLVAGLADDNDWVDYLDTAFNPGAVTVNLLLGVATGGHGNDSIARVENVRGSLFGDSLTGDGNANFLNGSGGDDFLDGGAGFDWASYFDAAGAMTVNLATNSSSGPHGSDTFANIEGIDGSNFNDVLTGNAADNWIRGRTGDDTLNGGAGDDFADYSFATGGVTVNLSTGTSSGPDGADTLIGFEHIRGSNFADTLIGDAGENALRGMAGNDFLDGGAGIDFADYRNATGAVNVDLGTGVTSGPDGDDAFVRIEGIIGSPFNDTIRGDGGDNFLSGWTGNDTVDGAGGFDTVLFTLAITPVIVNLDTGTSSGSGGNDQLLNFEAVEGGPFADQITGNAVDNALQGNAGDDTIDGGLGKDIAEYTASADWMWVDLDAGRSYGHAGNDGNDTLLNIEGVRGSDFGDVFIGNLAANEFFGGNGNDVIIAGDGPDKLFGEEESDWLQGDGGDDELYAGTSGSDVLLGYAGNDLLRADQRSSVEACILIGGTGADDVRGGPGNDWVEGGFFDSDADIVRGNGGDDTVVGGGGQDTLYGGTGNDILSQVDGQGTLYGEDGGDWLYGANLVDTLVGGKGVDNMLGYGGNDIFVFNAADLQAGVQDTIYSFGDFGTDVDLIRFVGVNSANVSVADFLGGGDDAMISVALGGGAFASIYIAPSLAATYATILNNIEYV